MQITHSVEETRGSYSYRESPADPAAQLTYSRAGDTMIILDHTEVPDIYRGRNIGVALVARAVEDARRGGVRVVPLCPFAATQFRRHPEWHDVLDLGGRPRA
jgi:predicted GNAT family acetyltransferase